MAKASQQIAQATIQPRLSAPLSKLRKQWLTSVKDLEPQAALAVLRQRLQSETEGAVRLGNMAAQSWIVRQRLFGLQEALHGVPVSVDLAEPEQEVAVAITAEAAPIAEAVAPENANVAPASDSADWTKLRILAETEVNGMRFFAGTTIQVHEEDARKLIEAKSAERVDAAEEAAPARSARSSKKAPPKK